MINTGPIRTKGTGPKGHYTQKVLLDDNYRPEGQYVQKGPARRAKRFKKDRPEGPYVQKGPARRAITFE
jgi:hypothetical protein